MASVVIPFKLRTASGVLSFLTTTTIFGTPIDVTLSHPSVPGVVFAYDSFASIAEDIEAVAAELGMPEHQVIKTHVMEDEEKRRFLMGLRRANRRTTSGTPPSEPRPDRRHRRHRRSPSRHPGVHGQGLGARG